MPGGELIGPGAMAPRSFGVAALRFFLSLQDLPNGGLGHSKLTRNGR